MWREAAAIAVVSGCCASDAAAETRFQGADAIAAAGGAATALAEQPRTAMGAPVPAVNEHRDVGRNDPCWCGSGKKFKRCHGA